MTDNTTSDDDDADSTAPEDGTVPISGDDEQGHTHPPNLGGSGVEIAVGRGVIGT